MSLSLSYPSPIPLLSLSSGCPSHLSLSCPSPVPLLSLSSDCPSHASLLPLSYLSSTSFLYLSYPSHLSSTLHFSLAHSMRADVYFDRSLRVTSAFLLAQSVCASPCSSSSSTALLRTVPFLHSTSSTSLPSSIMTSSIQTSSPSTLLTVMKGWLLVEQRSIANSTLSTPLCGCTIPLGSSTPVSCLNISLVSKYVVAWSVMRQ